MYFNMEPQLYIQLTVFSRRYSINLIPLSLALTLLLLTTLVASPSSVDSPLSSSIIHWFVAPSLFHSALKPTCFTNPFHRRLLFSTITDSVDYRMDRFFWAISVFGWPFVKRFALYYRTVVCLSVLSVCPVCDVGMLWPNGWIKMKLGLQVGLGTSHTVLDGNPAPPPKGHSSPLFGPCLLWLNGRPSTAEHLCLIVSAFVIFVFCSLRLNWLSVSF